MLPLVKCPLTNVCFLAKEGNSSAETSCQGSNRSLPEVFQNGLHINF